MRPSKGAETRLSGRQALTAPLIYGCAGTALSDRERAFFRDAVPLGFILFARNCGPPAQIRALIDDLRDTRQGAPVLILIDQEGGRVARLTPPHFREAPPANVFGGLARRDPAGGREAARLNARLFASELQPLGINVDCLPVLDVPVAGAHDIIGDRAFGADPDLVADLGRAAAEGLLSGGVLPVAKHIPGHGRAGADSHLALPVVDTAADELARIDFAPFHRLRDLPLAMTAHVVYSSLDPDRPATTSAAIIERVIRGTIGFDGLLMSDDISMAALKGPVGGRTRAALDAGCDIVLHCNGNMDEMIAIADRAGAISSAAERRVQAAFAKLSDPDPFDPVDGRARLDQLLNRR